ncbi:hypothetical protein K5X82_11670 [Halosquirtibacter xylanolyticus]|uniref:hypothetical protein n=1 Tax=Halosquirtibacter xylanolyticus TaxID=3374599 RepID=UPI003749751F|nr:hypothetical protein K5X82_11670 [Prolixibacteraceae bacterium]
MKTVIYFTLLLLICSSCDKKEDVELKNNDSDFVLLSKSLARVVNQDIEAYRLIMDNANYDESERRAVLLYPLLEKKFSSTTLSQELCKDENIDKVSLQKMFEEYPKLTIITFEEKGDVKDNKEEIIVIDALSQDPNKVKVVKAYDSNGKVKNIEVKEKPTEERNIIITIGNGYQLLTKEEIAKKEKDLNIELSKHQIASPIIGKYYISKSIFTSKN